MTAIAARTARAWTETHRLLLDAAFVVLAAVVAAAVAVTITLFATSGAERTVLPSTDGAPGYAERLPGLSVPTDADVLSPTERACQLARVAGC